MFPLPLLNRLSPLEKLAEEPSCFVNFLRETERETRPKGERETHSRTERRRDREREPNRRFTERYHTTPRPGLEVLMNRKKKFHARVQAAGQG